jgi:hypothetical protein
MTTGGQPQKGPDHPDDLARRLSALVEGLSIVRVLKADGREVVIELSDGTRLFARSDGQLEVSVT